MLRSNRKYKLLSPASRDQRLACSVIPDDFAILYSAYWTQRPNSKLGRGGGWNKERERTSQYIKISILLVSFSHNFEGFGGGVLLVMISAHLM